MPQIAAPARETWYSHAGSARAAAGRAMTQPNAPESAMHVRPARQEEIDAIVELSRRVQQRLTASGSLQQFGPIPRVTAAAHVAAGSALLLIDGGGEPIGGVFVEPEWAPATPEFGRVFAELALPPCRGPRWWLQKLMIAPERQGGGLGHLLLDGVRRHIVAHGGGTVVLDCWAGNDKLRAFYLAAGFRFHGEFHAEGYDVAAYTWTAPPAQS